MAALLRTYAPGAEVILFLSIDSRPVLLQLRRMATTPRQAYEQLRRRQCEFTGQLS
ncbi:hypothetical protein [Synechococcus sp. RSCCF101]|uniref:hypothetical protein n=1 Tax=Synechococcus sp. RSCCF101 TaxID=2511069 RepID=UPI001786C616|nr:hypothetical protein [Synechococcus sp. RSCCF101]